MPRKRITFGDLRRYSGGTMDAPRAMHTVGSLDELVRTIKPRKKTPRKVREVKMPTFKGGL